MSLQVEEVMSYVDPQLHHSITEDTFLAKAYTYTEMCTTLSLKGPI